MGPSCSSSSTSHCEQNREAHSRRPIVEKAFGFDHNAQPLLYVDFAKCGDDRNWISRRYQHSEQSCPDPAPTDDEVHSCGNRRCCNPNADEGESKGQRKLITEAAPVELQGCFKHQWR